MKRRSFIILLGGAAACRAKPAGGPILAHRYPAPLRFRLIGRHFCPYYCQFEEPLEMSRPFENGSRTRDSGPGAVIVPDPLAAQFLEIERSDGIELALDRTCIDSAHG
jgi:hypothetical protein